MASWSASWKDPALRQIVAELQHVEGQACHGLQESWNVEDRVRVRGQLSYILDNSALQAPTAGVSWRRSPNLWDCSDTRAYAPWGSVLFGDLLGTEWLQVGDQYLPTHIKGKQVVRRHYPYHASIDDVLRQARDKNAKEKIRVDTLRELTQTTSGTLYLVDNRVRQLANDGLAFRRSPNLADIAGSFYAAWGEALYGNELNDDWLQVGDLFLPTRLDGVDVLFLKRRDRQNGLPYLLDNSIYQASTRGIGFHKVPDLAAQPCNRYAAWGDVVHGHLWSDWLQVGDLFLPMKLEEAPVLVEQLYLLDNSTAQMQNKGIFFCTSPNLLNKTDKIARWGQLFHGQEVIDAWDEAWLQVGDYFLPTTSNGVQILVPPIPYLLDHPAARKVSEGVPFRKSRNMEDVDLVDPRIAPWGQVFHGYPIDIDWFRVGDLFLPMEMEGMQVLHDQSLAFKHIKEVPRTLAQARNRLKDMCMADAEDKQPKGREEKGEEPEFGQPDGEMLVVPQEELHLCFLGARYPPPELFESILRLRLDVLGAIRIDTVSMTALDHGGDLVIRLFAPTEVIQELLDLDLHQLVVLDHSVSEIIRGPLLALESEEDVPADPMFPIGKEHEASLQLHFPDMQWPASLEFEFALLENLVGLGANNLPTALLEDAIRVHLFQVEGHVAARVFGTYAVFEDLCNLDLDMIQVLNQKVGTILIASRSSPSAASHPVPSSPERSQWKVFLDKTKGATLGIDVGSTDGLTLLVTSVDAGLVQKWNQRNPERSVKPGDQVIEVNGISNDPQGMLYECQMEQLLEITVLAGSCCDEKLNVGAPGVESEPMTVDAIRQGAWHNKVYIDKAGGGQLGMDVGYVHGSLVITSISEGLSQEWNARNPERPVKLGDHVVEVNGIHNDPEGMQCECWTKQHLLLTVLPGRDADADSEKSAGSGFCTTVVIDRSSGAPLGIDTVPEDSLALIVTSVGEGLVQEWNEINPAEAVKAGDHLIEVNQIRSDPQRMLRECEKCQLLQFIVSPGNDSERDSRANRFSPKEFDTGETKTAAVSTDYLRSHAGIPFEEAQHRDLSAAKIQAVFRGKKGREQLLRFNAELSRFKARPSAERNQRRELEKKRAAKLKERAMAREFAPRLAALLQAFLHRNQAASLLMAVRANERFRIQREDRGRVADEVRQRHVVACYATPDVDDRPRRIWDKGPHKLPVTPKRKDNDSVVASRRTHFLGTGGDLHEDHAKVEQVVNARLKNRDFTERYDATLASHQVSDEIILINNALQRRRVKGREIEKQQHLVAECSDDWKKWKAFRHRRDQRQQDLWDEHRAQRERAARETVDARMSANQQDAISPNRKTLNTTLPHRPYQVAAETSMVAFVNTQELSTQNLSNTATESNILWDPESAIRKVVAVRFQRNHATTKHASLEKNVQSKRAGAGTPIDIRSTEFPC